MSEFEVKKMGPIIIGIRLSRVLFVRSRMTHTDELDGLIADILELDGKRRVARR